MARKLFSKKNPGWLQDYFSYRHNKPFETKDLVSSDSKDIGEFDQKIYSLIHPTGILYGFPFTLPFNDLSYSSIIQGQKKKDIAKLVFTESLFAILMADHHRQASFNNKESKEFFFKSINHGLNHFISGQVQLDEAHAPESMESLSYSTIRSWEKIIDKKVQVPANPVSFTSYLPNSWLFLDIFFCLQEQRQKYQDKQVNISLNKKEVITEIFQLIHAAIQANGQLEQQEKALLDQFLRAAQISPKAANVFRQIISKPTDLDTLELPASQPWLLRRFLLEISVLFLLADRTIDSDEEIFLNKLAKRLQLKDSDLEGAILAVEFFINQHKKDFENLTQKPKILSIDKDFQDRCRKVLMKNKERLQQELSESRELYYLLRKSRAEQLTQEEKEKVRLQLIDVLKTIPVFVIIGLPGTFMTLPFLIKIIPNSYFPTAFQDSEDKEEQSISHQDAKNTKDQQQD